MAEPRTWRVGELARLTGLTVRTLHHYDELGLLVPSSRTSGDHRRYDEEDLRRLLAIGHLKSLGLSLEEIGAALDDPGFSLSETLHAQARAVRERLAAETRLLRMLEALGEGDVGSWRDVVEAIALTERLGSSDPYTRLRAALDAPGAAPLAELVDRLVAEDVDGVRETLTWAVAQHGERATPVVLAAYRDADATGRLRLAHALSKLRDPAALPTLAAALDDPDDLVAAKAAFALGRLRSPEAARALVERLDVAEPRATAVVAALGQVGDVALVAARLRDPSARVRARAADALAELGDESAVPALAPLVDDPEPEVAVAALMALASLGGAAAEVALAAGRNARDARVRLLAGRLAP